MICHYFAEPTYFFFASDLPLLLYYSHIPVALLALGIGIFLLVNSPKQLPNQLLFIISILFAGWTTINLIAWTNIHSDFLLSLWPLFGIISALIAVYAVYFSYAFAYKKDVSPHTKAVFVILLLPILLLAHTDYSVSGFQISDCDAFGFEGFWYNLYYTALGGLAMIWSAAIFISRYRSAEPKFKKQLILMGAGIQSFIAFFFFFVWFASYLANAGLVEDSNIEFYGFFGMALFLLFIGILMTRFKAFNVGLLTTQALLVALVTLVGSLITIAETRTAFILGSVTLALTLLSGLLLNRSVKKEILQREKLEVLTKDLAHANERLEQLDKLKSEFVSIASHQLRSPLTAMRGYASMLVEGSFGKMPKKAIEASERIAESARLMAMAVEDYLNVSRIESGNMKYNLSDFNLKEKVESICEDLRAEAMRKGLVLLFRSRLESRGVVTADVGKTIQIIHNLINNSLKYTPEGSINVSVYDNIRQKKVFVEISDTGVGMSEKTLRALFEKFSRADNANQVNTSGTGLGLYVAHKMSEEMGGDITATSEGEGKGSCFTLELPLASTKK